MSTEEAERRAAAKAEAEAKRQRALKRWWRAVAAGTLPWALSGSLFAGRQKWSDSCAFWDSHEVLLKCFDADWDYLVRSKGFTRFCYGEWHQRGEEGTIVGVHGARGISVDKRRHQRMGFDPANSLAQVRTALLKHHRLIYLAFQYYSCTDGQSPDPALFRVQAFRALVRDCRLAVANSPHCSAQALEAAFVMVNVSAGIQQRNAQARAEQGSTQSIAPGGGSASKSLCRAQLMHVLVRAAVARHALEFGDGREGLYGVAEAIDDLCVQDLAAHLPWEATIEPNDWRRKQCYIQQVDMALRVHVLGLRTLFDRYATERVISDGEMKDKMVMPLSGWLRFCLDLRIINLDFRERDAQLAFLWSRHAVIDDRSCSGQERLRNLCFEDFLEALCHVAWVKALPTDKELHQAGYGENRPTGWLRDAALQLQGNAAHEEEDRAERPSLATTAEAVVRRTRHRGALRLNADKDAGHYVLEMPPRAWRIFCAAKARSARDEPPQPLSRALTHLLAVLLRTVFAAVEEEEARAGVHIGWAETFRRKTLRLSTSTAAAFVQYVALASPSKRRAARSPREIDHAPSAMARLQRAAVAAAVSSRLRGPGVPHPSALFGRDESSGASSLPTPTPNIPLDRRMTLAIEMRANEGCSKPRRDAASQRAE